MKKIMETALRFFRENRRLVPAFIAIAVLSALVIAKAVYGYHQYLSGEIEVKTEQLENYRELLARKGQPEKADAKERFAGLEKRTIKSDTFSTGAAYLQECFRKLAQKRGVLIESQRPLAPAQDGPYTKVAVEYRLIASVPQLKELLTDLRSAPVLIGVGALRIRSQERTGKLDVELMVEGAASGNAAKGES